MNALNLEIHRKGATAKLIWHAKPYSHETPITLNELEHVALYLANEVGLWRDELRLTVPSPRTTKENL